MILLIRPTVIANYYLKEVIECYPNKSTQELSYDLEYSQSTIPRLLTTHNTERIQLIIKTRYRKEFIKKTIKV